MTREQLEHLIRAAAAITDDDAIVVIGTQAILGQFPEAPASMRASMEADLPSAATPSGPPPERCGAQ